MQVELTSTEPYGITPDEQFPCRVTKLGVVLCHHIVVRPDKCLTGTLRIELDCGRFWGSKLLEYASLYGALMGDDGIREPKLGRAGASWPHQAKKAASLARLIRIRTACVIPQEITHRIVVHGT